MQNYIQIASLVFLALIPHAGIGSILFKKNLISGFILSMLILTGIVCPLAYLNTIFIKPIIFIYLAFGSYFLFKNWRVNFNLTKSQILIFLFFSLIFLWYFRSLSPGFYIFNDHDLLYFSWIGEFINPTIQGPLRLDVSWPNQMASNHLIPGGVIAISSVLLEKQTLISSIAVRYLLISFYFSYFFSHWVHIKKLNPYKFLIIVILAMSLYGQEIGYELRISSFIYVILILEIIKNLFISPNKQVLLGMALFLIIAKAPIFFIALFFSIWIAYLNKEKITPSIWLIITLVILNFASWFIMPQPEVHGGKPFLLNILKREDLLSLNGLKGWFITDKFSEIVFKLFKDPILTFLLLIYILVKYYVPYFLITKKIVQKKEFNKIATIDMWVIPSILCWAFIRYPVGIGHTAHLYILMSIITLFFVIKYVSEHKSIYPFNALLLLALLYGYPNKIFDPLTYVIYESSKNLELTMKISELKNGYLNDKDNENYAVKNQIRSAMIGEKIDSRATQPTRKSIIYHWIIQK